MANLDPSASGRKKRSGFPIIGFSARHTDRHSHVQAMVQEKHVRLARKSLYDMVVFHDALENEMQCMLANVDEGLPLDSELFQRMMIVKGKYLEVMHGLRQYEDGRERHALIAFADAVQDLMVYLHRQRRH